MKLINFIDMLNLFLNGLANYHIIYWLVTFYFYKFFFEIVEFMDEYLRYIIFISLLLFSQNIIAYIEANNLIQSYWLSYLIHYLIYNFFILFSLVLIKEYKQTFNDLWAIVRVIYRYSIAPIIKLFDKIFFKPNPTYTNINQKPINTLSKTKKPVKKQILNTLGVYTSTNKKLELYTDSSKRGGEAFVYEASDGSYAKIFHNTNIDMSYKENVISKLVNTSLSNSIVTPKELIYNQDKKFIGFTMNKVEGIELGQILLNKVTDYFPKYNLIDIINLAISIIDVFEEVHKESIIVGDINPRNLLVQDKLNVYLIDVDSFQLDSPSPSYMEEYRKPKHYGKTNKFMRSTFDDSYAIFVIVFQLLHYGLLPFGGTDEESLREAKYVFNPYYQHKYLIKNKTLIKAHNRLSLELKISFNEVFKRGKYVLISVLKSQLQNYKQEALKVLNK